MKCIDLLISTLNDILHADKEKEKEMYQQNLQILHDQKDQVVLTCIKIVDLISEYCILQEKNRGTSLEEIENRMFQNKQKKIKYKQYMV